MRFLPQLFPSLALALIVAGTASAAETQIATDKPIINFRLPTFTAEGYREWLVRGSEASLAHQDQIGIKELTMSIFSGKADERLVTMILSPIAVVHPAESVVTGPGTIRVINDEFEATGTNWRYAHKEKKVYIAKKVRVSFRAEFKDYLK